MVSQVAMLSDVAFNDLAERCDELRKQVNSADALSLSKQISTRYQAAILRAGAYVWSAAALEAFVRNELDLLAESLSRLSVNVDDVRPSLRTILVGSEFDSLGQLRGLKAWLKRAELIDKATAKKPAVFTKGIHPLDRRTLKAAHFEAIWTVCGLQGSSLPSARHGLALSELARYRNELAHGHVDAIAFGRGKTTSDAIRAIDAVEDVAEHFHVALDSLVASGGYRR